VLVVDDNRDTVESLAMVLRLLGNEVATATDGPTALRVAEEFRPTAVILDIGLPMMDGFQVAERLRGLPGLGGALIVASSGYAREADLRRARDAGIDEYLVKPFDPYCLKSLLDVGRVSANTAFTRA
jgi:CheY-like chemotaxis protein